MFVTRQTRSAFKNSQLTGCITLNDLPRQFLSRFRKDPESGCWLWTGALFAGTGYGSFTYQREHWRAHRFSWTIHNGPIPKKLQVCHTCDTPRCVNPDHLWLGTAKDNQLDKARKGRHWQQKKTCCPWGHEYTFENTYWDPKNHRHCRTCRRMAPAQTWMPIDFGSYIKERHAKITAWRREGRS